jgi:CubicO group peptidase (beta-lactamase class C family)
MTSIPADPSEDGLARARRRLESLVVRGRVPGAQLVVRRHGEVVLSTALGVARGFRPSEPGVAVPVREDTAFAVFSAGKPVVATAIALCEARGLLDAERPVATYFPEFAQNGKSGITLVDVLTHRSGILLPELSYSPARWRDLDHVAEALARAAPVHPRGTLAYAPLEYGWIMGEVIRRVTGRTFGDFVADEIAAPLALPALGFGARGRPHASLAKPYWLGGSTFVAGRDVSRGFEDVNESDDFLEAELPGAGLVTDAASLAAFYDFWLRGGIAPGGLRLLSPERVARQLRCHARGFDRSNRAPLAVARGFLLGTLGPSAYGFWGTQRCYGHAGAFSTLAFADPDRDLAVALVTNGNRGRAALLLELMPVVDAVRRSFLRETCRS